MDTPRRYGSPAKRHGWGWGLPTCWQGWAVFAAYAASLALIRRWLPPATDHALFLTAIVIATGLLLTVCWLKGEPPGSRGRP